MDLNREQVAKIIWPQLQNSKFKEYYLELLLERNQKQDRIINIFLILVTSTSISAWAIWKTDTLQWVWAGLVALSQIIQLIRPYLNSKHIKEFNEKYFQIQALNLEYEKLWFNFKFEKLTIEKCFDKSFELKVSLSKYLKFNDQIIITENTVTNSKARDKVLLFLKNNYNYEQKT